MKSIVVTGKVAKIMYHDGQKVCIGVERDPPLKYDEVLAKDESSYMQVFVLAEDASGIAFGAKCKLTLELL